MASNEPTGGASDNGPQEYAQPQDPWEGGLDFPPGQASMPTDPIPHQYDPYSGTYPPQQPYQSGTWVQPGTGGHTVPPVGWAPQPPPAPKPSKAIPILIALAVLLVLGGGGAAAWYVATQDDDPGVVTPTTAAPTSGAPATSAAPVTSAAPTDGPFDPFGVKENDCVANAGTNAKPKMAVVECTAGVYKVIKVLSGASVKQNTDDVLSDEEARATCKGTGFTFFYKNNFDGTDQDIIFCMTKVGA